MGRCRYRGEVKRQWEAVSSLLLLLLLREIEARNSSHLIEEHWVLTVDYRHAGQLHGLRRRRSRWRRQWRRRGLEGVKWGIQEGLRFVFVHNAELGKFKSKKTKRQ